MVVVGYRQELDRALEAVESQVIELFAMIIEDLPLATIAFLDGDSELGPVLAERQRTIDTLCPRIAMTVSRVIVRQVPVAGDLRFLLSAMRSAAEFEHAHRSITQIADRADPKLSIELSARDQELMVEMGALAASMWRQTADAWYRQDRTAADVLAAHNREMRELHASLIIELASGVMSGPMTMESTLAGRFYARLGDDALTVANRVNYMAGSAAE
jgi:phosphate transport system protein